jgi:hypothetical protein
MTEQLLSTQYQYNTEEIPAKTSDIASHLDHGDKVAVEVDRSELGTGTGHSEVWVSGTARDEASGTRAFSVVDPSAGTATVSESQLQAAMDKEGSVAVAVSEGDRKLSD